MKKLSKALLITGILAASTSAFAWTGLTVNNNTNQYSYMSVNGSCTTILGLYTDKKASKTFDPGTVKTVCGSASKCKAEIFLSSDKPKMFSNMCSGHTPIATGELTPDGTLTMDAPKNPKVVPASAPSASGDASITINP